MLTIQNLSYTHLNKDVLFNNLNLTVNYGDKIAIIGNNGVGKSTLLKIMAQELQAAQGSLKTEVLPYFIPQIFGQFNHLTIAEALGIDEKLEALNEILAGNTSNENFIKLNDDWAIEERCKEALVHWELSKFDLTQKMETLSGGEKTKVFLAGISIHQPKLILLDEPSNHLDVFARNILYDFLQKTKSTLIIVSHDRKLLNHLTTICELNKNGIKVYGGNYDFYKAQKEIETNALSHDIQSKEKALKKAKEKERESLERQQKLDARAKKSLSSAGLPKIVSGTWKNNAERSGAKLADVHSEKVGNIKQELQGLRSSLSEMDSMKFGFDNAKIHKGKKLFIAENINFSYKNETYLWKKDLSLEIVSGERIHIKGANGAGKTTLNEVILGNLSPQKGTVFIAQNQSVYIDQEYSILKNNLNIYEQAQQFNTHFLPEHEVKMRLSRFLFSKEDWQKSCTSLSGGERMRLMLCCLNIRNQSPDIIILDEPTNNLDIQNIEILISALADYQGTLLVVSHDESFLEQINIERKIELYKK